MKLHENIIVIPTEDDRGNWHGNEYLQLYRQVTDAVNDLGQPVYAMFEPNMVDHGIPVEYL